MRRGKYPRYREPIFSRGFTVFLIMLAIVAAGFAVYIALFAGANPWLSGLLGRSDIEDLTPGEYEYMPRASSDDETGYYENEDMSIADNTGEYVSQTNNPPNSTNDTEEPANGTTNNGGPGNPGNYTNATNNEPEPYGPYEPNGQYELNEPYTPFVLLTTVDNSLLPWYLKLVNRYNFLDYYFYPQLASIGNGHYFDYRAYQSLLDMLASARAEGLSPIVASSFRSVSRQTTLFRNRVQRFVDQGYDDDDAFEAARRIVAYPGTSEHNLGLAVDIVALSYQNLTANQANTPEGIWLAENSYRYGFVLRYPYDKQDITNIIFEPWHFRYVGRYAAEEMFYRNLVLEEFVSELLAP